MVYCPNCGSPNEPGSQHCNNCGLSLQPMERTGSNGKPAVAGPAAEVPAVVYQPQAPVTVPQPPTAAKSKLVAALLGIFLGAFGAHRFYLGFTNLGLAHLAVGLIGLALAPFTCGLILMGGAIWGFVDAIMILTGSLSADAQGRPLRD